MPDDTPQAVPIIDISPFASPSSHDDEARAATADEWDRAMQDVGFAIITGHGVTPETISAVRAGAMSFFTLDAESKNSFNYGPYGNPLGGYTGMGTEAVSRTRDAHGSDGGTADEEKAAKIENQIMNYENGEHVKMRKALESVIGPDAILNDRNCIPLDA